MILPIPLWMFAVLLASLLTPLVFKDYGTTSSSFRFDDHGTVRRNVLNTCSALYRNPEPLQDFFTRNTSDRFEKGTRPTLIKNATIFTGEYNDTDHVVIYGDVFLDRGVVSGLGGSFNVDVLSAKYKGELVIIDAQRAWVTPGLIDLHSHMGISSLPILDGSQDASSKRGPVVPWLRVLDALHTNDPAFQLAIASGVTSAQIMPGNENIIGGQPAMIKLRRTSVGSPSSMLVDPAGDTWGRLHHSVGEAPGRAYGMTRMDSVWALRDAYGKAQETKSLQEEYCRKAEADLLAEIEDTDFPEELEWKTLVEVLWGNVKVSVHFNEAVDLEAIARVSEEFKFPISVLHQASEAWLAPQLLNETWGELPSVALSSTEQRSRRESFRGSEHAARVLADWNVPIIMQSGYPTSSSRSLIFEARQAHYYGLPLRLAIASVTSSPAAAVGVAHRIGRLKEGLDADVVLWDSHPLNVGAKPLMVWIDGALQIPGKAKNESVDLNNRRHVLEAIPDWESERNASMAWQGSPPFSGKQETGKVVFQHVQEAVTRKLNGDIQVIFEAKNNDSLGVVVVDHGKVVCAEVYCSGFDSKSSTLIDIHGGSISPGFLAYGSALGLSEIVEEPSTGGGNSPYDAFITDVPKILHDSGGLTRAADSLIFQTRHAMTAYRAGVTSSVSFGTSPLGGPVISGLSAAFRTGSLHAMQYGAILQDVAALHVNIAKPRHTGGVSVSSQIAGLRRLLHGWESTETETGLMFKKASEGIVSLVIDVHSADIMATLLLLKSEVEDRLGSRMRMVFSGATEAHLLAEEIAKFNVGVIITSEVDIPKSWDQRRSPLLSNATTLGALLNSGVLVGIGESHPQLASNIRFDLSSVANEESLGRAQVYALGTKNLEILLGLRVQNNDLVVYDAGNTFQRSSKAVAVISPQMGFVDLFDP